MKAERLTEQAEYIDNGKGILIPKTGIVIFDESNSRGVPARTPVFESGTKKNVVSDYTD